MKKVLFLDFDGVLHPATINNKSEHFSRNFILEEAIKDLECEIVISSSWRFHTKHSDLLSNLSSNLASRVTGSTGEPYIGKHSRYQEILNYIKANDCLDLDWMALDDAYYEFPNSFDRLILCNPNIGVTKKEAEVLKNWLKK